MKSAVFLAPQRLTLGHFPTLLIVSNLKIVQPENRNSASLKGRICQSAIAVVLEALSVCFVIKFS